MRSCRYFIALIACLNLWGGLAQATSVQTAAAKLRNSSSDKKSAHHNEYELAIYRLPSGTELAKQLCQAGRPCQRQQKNGYSFYALNSNFDEIDNDFIKMRLSALQQYVVSGNYELTPGKYFSVSFKKSGEVNGGVLFEEISFVVKPRQLKSGLMDIDVFGLFKYHVLGSGTKSNPLDRQTAFKSQISEAKNFLLIAEASADKNEPVYLAVIKQCNEIVIPSYEVQLLEKRI